MSTKTTKALVAALVLAGASIAFVADASAAPTQPRTQYTPPLFDSGYGPPTDYYRERNGTSGNG